MSLSSEPARAQFDSGVALARSGHYEEAAAAFRRVIDANPSSLAAHINLGIAFAATGRLDSAIATFRNALALAPNEPQLHFTLGAALKCRGALYQAIVAYERAVSLAPSVAGFNNLGSALRELGRTDAAIVAFRQALRIDASASLVHLNLGTALEDQGRLEEAASCYERALVLEPALEPAQRALAQVLVERDLVEQGFAQYRRYARQRGERRRASAMQARAQERKRRYDREQADYLQHRADDAPGLLIDETVGSSGPALNAANQADRIETAWMSADPKIVVVDDLLTPDALEGLRRFCWGSRIWNSTYPGGYLGAFPEDGFAPALLARVSREFRERFPRIFGRLPLKLWWAFTCDAGAPGIGVHADFAAVNVNFWITPNEANLDADSGGLQIWNVPAPANWDYRRYNASPDLIRQFLSSAGAKSVIVPYRANRAVIFDSDLFHETHRPRFKAGYLNRRINITLLYGLRERG